MKITQLILLLNLLALQVTSLKLRPKRSLNQRSRIRESEAPDVPVEGLCANSKDLCEKAAELFNQNLIEDGILGVRYVCEKNEETANMYCAKIKPVYPNNNLRSRIRESEAPDVPVEGLCATSKYLCEKVA